MDVQIFFANQKEKKELTDGFIEESLGSTIKCFTEDEQSESDILADCVYEDFIKCR